MVYEMAKKGGLKGLVGIFLILLYVTYNKYFIQLLLCHIYIYIN
jgi:hypothetical protein